jgi:cysteine desulfurase
VLYVRSGQHGVNLDPLIFGGNQERARRSGTEAVAEHVGLAKALTLARTESTKESKRLMNLRNFFIRELLKIPGTYLNGDAQSRLPNNVNIGIDGFDGEAGVLHLDEYNIQCSTGSACTSTETAPSHVLLALGKSEQEANSCLRFTLGRATTKQDVEYTCRVLRLLVERLRSVKNL